MLPVVDANVLLRYLLDDVGTQHDKAEATIRNGCEATVEVLAEVIYVLAGVYHVPREAISSALLKLIDEVYFARHDEVAYALRLYGERGLDFVDCVLAAQSKVSGRAIVTFDKKLRRIIDGD